jgi:2,4-dienoyl-CoA reductase-like NADH-dependent reductase (Old Yellow Enzyme family)/thioredoxin reductase
MISNDMKYTKMFEPGKIGRVTVKNRVVLPPMGTGLASFSGEASPDIIRYYEERAKGGCGLIITEITRVDEEHGWGLARQLAVTKGGFISGLQRLVNTVHKYGTKVFVQLHHPGREGHARINPNKNQIVAPTAMVTERCNEMPHELTTEEVEAMVSKYVIGATIAKFSGADGIELHAAHGYFINQFLSPFSNKRTDKYGGSFEKRMRFIKEVILGIHKMCGPDFPIGVRLSVDEFMGDKGITLEMGVEIVKYLEKLNINHIHVSCGIYESGHNIIPIHIYPQACRRNLSQAIKDAVSIPVISINNIKEPKIAEQLLEEGVCDFVAVGRGQLADPEWVNKARKGEDISIRKCIGCCRCIEAISYGRHFECSVNPRLGRELEFLQLEKNGEGKKIVVVGGGPAGMQAAKVLAQRNFKVTLFEAQEKLGGALDLAGKNIGKEKLVWLIDTMNYELEQLGVDVRLNTRATEESIKELNPYGVFVCCGGKHIEPKIPGIESEKTIRVKDYLEGKAQPGKKVAVIGSGATGIETAATLASRGHEVTVIEMMPKIGSGIINRVLGVLIARLTKSGVSLLPGHKLTAINDTGVKLEKMEDGSEVEMEFDSVILALGIGSQQKYANELASASDNSVVLGDALLSSTVLEAIRDANGSAWVF